MKGYKMKNNNFSQPYRSLGFDKIEAPASTPKNQPKSTKTAGNDLRVGGKKK